MKHNCYTLYRRYEDFWSKATFKPYLNVRIGAFNKDNLLRTIASYDMKDRLLPSYAIYSNYSGYFVLDSDNKYVDITPYFSIIDDLRASILKERLEKHNKRMAISAVMDRHPGHQFRNGTVPYIRKCKWHRGCFYRKPRLYGVIRSNTEYKEFYTARNNLSEAMVFDEKVRHNDKSWKTSYKVRKQWMKHMDRHCDTVDMQDYFEDEQYLEEVC